MYVNLTRKTQKLLSVICLKIERLKIGEILKSHKNYKMSIGPNHSQLGCFSAQLAKTTP